MDTCKKRWKYLRERYVQQKKVGGSPASYEHLSRPYLEKMKFLDAFIQSRKSYRATGLFTNPTSIMHTTFDESSKSNGSMRMTGAHLNADNDDAFSQFYQMSAFSHGNMSMKSEMDSAANDMHHLKKHSDITGNMPSSSSSIASQESPATQLSNSTTHEMDDSSSNLRKRRHITNTSISGRNGLLKTEMNHTEQLNLSENDEDPNSINNDDASDHNQSSPLDVSPTNIFDPLYNSAHFRRSNEMNSTTGTDEFPNPADLLHPQLIYQQAIARQFRNSDQLLGELVTSELIKMSRDRKKIVQKKILGILFFDDD